MNQDPKKFWEFHQNFGTAKENQADEEFKDLFMRMVDSKPEARCGFDDIKDSNLYSGEIYSNLELADVMQPFI